MCENILLFLYPSFLYFLITLFSEFFFNFNKERNILCILLYTLKRRRSLKLDLYLETIKTQKKSYNILYSSYCAKLDIINNHTLAFIFIVIYFFLFAFYKHITETGNGVLFESSLTSTIEIGSV